MKSMIVFGKDEIQFDNGFKHLLMDKIHWKGW